MRRKKEDEEEEEEEKREEFACAQPCCLWGADVIKAER